MDENHTDLTSAQQFGLNFWSGNAPVAKVGNPISDASLSFLPCWMRVEKSVKRFWPYFIAFKSCISNGKPK